MYLTTRQIADVLGLRDTYSVVRLIESGRLPCERRRPYDTRRGVRVQYRVTLDEFRAYLGIYDPAMLAHCTLEKFNRENRENQIA